MARPLNEFGGWLKIFQFIVIIGATVATLLLIYLLYLVGVMVVEAVDIEDFIFILSEPELVVLFGTGLIPIVISLVFNIKILRIIQHKDPTTPEHIYYYLKIMLFVILGFLIIEIPWSYSVNGDILLPENFKMFQYSIQAMIQLLIWMLYLKKSKRVKAYYGEKNSAPVNE